MIKFLTTCILAILLLTSCATTKEMRRANKAARLVERATLISPAILHPDTHNLKAELLYPGAVGSLTAPVPPTENADSVIAEINSDPAQLPMIITRLVTAPCLANPVYFEDDSLSAKIHIIDGQIILDYTIKPQTVTGEIQHIEQNIKPTRYIPIPLKWWQISLMVFGGVFLVYISCVAIIFTIKK